MLLLLAGCHSAPVRPVPPAQTADAPVTAPTPQPAPPPAPAFRGGDEIIVAGRRFHTGTRVVTWKEPGGYNAYLKPVSTKPRAGLAKAGAKPSLASVQAVVDQFVLHYDGGGLSKICFNTLQQRKLSVHFLLDLDGTIYQTLDLQERALHATTANDRSIGIEIANVGAYAPTDTKLLREWYRSEPGGQTRVQIPVRIAHPGILTPGFIARPARAAPVRGRLQGQELVQYDYTPQQYEALIRLTAALCQIFPRLACDFPRDSAGRLVTTTLPPRELERYRGLLGHYHVQENKTDPGPALDWRRVIDGARLLLK